MTERLASIYDLTERPTVTISVADVEFLLTRLEEVTCDRDEARALVRRLHERATDATFLARAEAIRKWTHAGHCPTCDSPAPNLHPAVQFEGEVSPCDDPFHASPSPGAVNAMAGGDSRARFGDGSPPEGR